MLNIYEMVCLQIYRHSKRSKYMIWNKMEEATLNDLFKIEIFLALFKKNHIFLREEEDNPSEKVTIVKEN